jgi:hypothetical protein
MGQGAVAMNAGEVARVRITEVGRRRWRGRSSDVNTVRQHS